MSKYYTADCCSATMDSAGHRMGTLNEWNGSGFLTAKTQVLMVGCGNMGGALLARWLDQPEFAFTVVSPSGRALPGGIAATRNPAELQGRTFDLVVIAVKPQMIPEVLPAYVGLLAEGGCLLSVAAGFSADSIASLVGDKPLVRSMPNMPVQIGKGVSALFANPQATPQHRQLVDRLMATTGTLLWVDSEDDIDRVTAIAGSGPGYVYEIARAWTAAGETLGFSEEKTRAMVLQTLAGSVEVALGGKTPLSELRNGVTSKNGTTAAGLSALNGNHTLDHLFQETVDAAYARARELR